MNRRDLLKSLAGAVAAPVVPAPSPVLKPRSLGASTIAAANSNPLFNGAQLCCVLDPKTGLASIYSYKATPDNRLEVTKVLP